VVAHDKNVNGGRRDDGGDDAGNDDGDDLGPRVDLAVHQYRDRRGKRNRERDGRGDQGWVVAPSVSVSSAWCHHASYRTGGGEDEWRRAENCGDFELATEGLPESRPIRTLDRVTGE